MTRRRLLRAGLVLVALGAGLLASPSGAGAASMTKTGWWYRPSEPASFVPDAAAPPVPLPDTPTEAPPPPTVPEGSLLVEGTPEGATAVAALTWTLSEGESSPVLTITPNAGSSVPPEGVILACRAAVDWTPPETLPGRWQDKPLVDCGRSVNGIVSVEDSTITFALAPLVSGTDLDVVLVPGVVGETPVARIGSAFSLAFDAATGAVLQTTSSGGSGSSSTTFAPVSSGSGGGSSSFSPPSGSTFTAPSAPVVEPALEPQEQAPTVPEQPMLAAPAATEEESDTAQGVAFIILLAGAALAGLAYLSPERADENATATVGLGRFRRTVPAATVAGRTTIEPVEGGLGRFTRPRVGPPQPLS